MTANNQFLVDSHCHLDFPDFAEELNDIVARAEAAGVKRMVTISTRVEKFPNVLAIAKRFTAVYCSVGTHPHNAAEESDITVENLVELSQHPKVVAIGEAGFDFYYDKAPRDVQASVFIKHVEAARLTGLPLVIHARSADREMIDILQQEMEKGAFKAILHCFSSSRALAETGIELGLMVSFSGILTFRNSQEIRDIARDIPLDRLLVETDAPYLAPVPMRGKRNEPSYVVNTAKVLAETRGISAGDIHRITTGNFFRLFSKIARPGQIPNDISVST